jgi:hypothetical protein
MPGLFRSLRPLYNPIGFGASDFILLAWAVLLVVLLLAAIRFEPALRVLAQRTRWSIAVLMLLPVILRLALLSTAPAPPPRTPDDFSFMLLGDTLAHFRLANRPHPMSRFFETNFVLQDPTYSSIYPLGQGLILAFGQIVFHQQWAGVLLSAGLFCGLCFWMLRGWTTPGWALVGGLLAVVTYGPLQYWMNTYWGGYPAAAGGCLVFGALPRIEQRYRVRDGALLAIGIAAQWLTRPFETLLVVASVALYFALWLRGKWRAMARTAAVACLVLIPVIALTLLHNRQVTGNWTTLPYMLSQYQYGTPASFTFQPVPTPHRRLTLEQKIDYVMQADMHGVGADRTAAFFRRLLSRLRFLRFFFPVPLLLALPALLPALRQKRLVWVVLSLVMAAVGTNFYPYFYPHYIAGFTCLLVLVAIAALEQVARWNREVARLLVLLCGAQFLFWYGLHLLYAWAPAMALTEQYESWDYVNHGDPEGRFAIERRLAMAAGKQLVFVRYWPGHRLDQWVWNRADIDGSRIVRALDLGPEENRRLQDYYPGRTSWLLEPDAQPPRLAICQSQPEAPRAAPARPPAKNNSPFEELPDTVKGRKLLRAFLLSVVLLCGLLLLRSLLLGIRLGGRVAFRGVLSEQGDRTEGDRQTQHQAHQVLHGYSPLVRRYKLRLQSS